MKSNSSTKFVDLREILINDVGLKNFSESLKINNTLTKIDFSQNEIGAE